MGLDVSILSLLPPSRLVMVVGSYGSGKTEISVNLALRLAATGRQISIADLDIVNPYFRCREAARLMEGAGIRVVIPPGDKVSADLPIVVPEIKGMLKPAEGEVDIFDVGGDPVGARLLSSFATVMGGSGYAMWHVINGRRPFTATAEGCLKMIQEIQESSRLKVTGLIANSHLIAETTPEVIIEGYRLAREVSAGSGIPVVFVAAMEELADDGSVRDLDAPVLRMTRRMLPPWLKARECGGGKTTGEDGPAVPAGRSVPLGRRGV